MNRSRFAITALAASAVGGIALAMFVTRSSGGDPFAAPPTEPKSKQARISYLGLGTDVEIIGPLGTSLWTLTTVEGAIFEYPADEPAPKAALWETYFDVDLVGDRKLDKPVRVTLRWDEKFNADALKPGRRLRLEGYEHGQFHGILHIRGDANGKYRDPFRAGQAWGFYVDFHVLEAAPAGPKK